MMGCRIVISEFEYVEGTPDLHLLLIGSIFQCRHGMGSEPKQKWFEYKANVSREDTLMRMRPPFSVASSLIAWSHSTCQRIAMLREHWNHVKSMDHVPPVTAYSYMGHLYQLCTEIDALKSRLLRRQEFYNKMRQRTKTFMWAIQRARATGIEEDFYHVKHMNNRYHNYVRTQNTRPINLACVQCLLFSPLRCHCFLSSDREWYD
jgi:hypothetical protein